MVPIDQNISPVSSNPVENKAIYNKFNEINTRIDGIDAELDNVVHKNDSTYTTLQSTIQEHSTAIEGKASLNSETGRLEPKQGPVMILKSIDGFNDRSEGYSEENLEEGEYCSSFVRIQSLHANIKTRKNGNIVTVGKPDTETLYYNLDDESLYHYTGLNSWSKIKTASSTPLPISIELG